MIAHTKKGQTPERKGRTARVRMASKSPLRSLSVGSLVCLRWGEAQDHSVNSSIYSRSPILHPGLCLHKAH